jgi:hypothetical protein
MEHPIGPKIIPFADDSIKTVDGIGKNPRDQQSDYYWVFSMNLLRRLERTLRFWQKPQSEFSV